MYKKNKMLSAIAAIAVLSSGAIAFDTNPNGDIISALDGCNKDYNAGYVGAFNEANTSLTGDIANLELSTTSKGDALIYPAFNSEDGWETDIVVRNVRNTAIVAKAVIYREYDSAELLDFNIYLSPHDVARFTIKDGEVTTKDYSIIGSIKGTPTETGRYPMNWEGVVSKPQDGPDHDKNVIAFNSEYFGVKKHVGYLNKDVGDLLLKDKDGNIIKDENGKEITHTMNRGYVVIYGMMETETEAAAKKYHTDTKVFKDGTKEEIAKATGHKDLFLDYRRVLDACRPTWREGFKGNNMKQGMFTDKVTIQSPSIHANCDDGIFSDGLGFTSTAKDAFLGTVEISHPEDDQRNLLLPATALSNFTVPNQMMLWAEGEYASIQDRRLVADSASSVTTYNVNGIVDDADTFLISKTYYTYKAGLSTENESNTLLITQPMKRPLIQLADPKDYWQEDSCNNNDGSDTWGYFQFNQKIYDEDEREYADEAGLVSITSPYTTSRNDEPFRNELQAIKDLEETGDAEGVYFAEQTNGYIDIDIQNSGSNIIPGIVTQMTNSKMSNEAQINWIYAPVDKVK